MYLIDCHVNNASYLPVYFYLYISVHFFEQFDSNNTLACRPYTSLMIDLCFCHCFSFTDSRVTYHARYFASTEPWHQIGTKISIQNTSWKNHWFRSNWKSFSCTIEIKPYSKVPLRRLQDKRRGNVINGKSFRLDYQEETCDSMGNWGQLTQNFPAMVPSSWITFYVIP